MTATAADAEQLQQLPMEDVVWHISLLDHDTDSGDDESDQELQRETSATSVSKMAVIADSRKSFIGAGTVLPTMEDLGDALVQVVLGCAHQPLCGKPRRPRYVRIKTEEFVDSESCEAMFYCSEACQKSHLGMTSDCHGHQKWCSMVKKYRALEKTLADLPFTFMKETSDADFDQWELRAFLAGRQLLGRGYWQLECAVQCQKQHPTHHGDLLLGLNSEANPYAVEDSVILASGPSSSVHPLYSPFQNWAEYYSWRGLSMESPLAVLLHWCLTLYHVLVNCWPKHYPGAASVMSRSHSVLVHLVGVGKEVDLAPTFFELNHLLPGINITIVMIGPDLSERSHDKVIQQDKVKVMVHRGLYHKYCGCTPDIVIGFNAGLGAYKTWTKTLAALKTSQIPAYFTDYCQYSCEYARGPIEAPPVTWFPHETRSSAGVPHAKVHCAKTQTGGARSPTEGASSCTGVTRSTTMSDILVNPFRSPIRKHCEEHRMPWYPNAFIYCLRYH